MEGKSATDSKYDGRSGSYANLADFIKNEELSQKLNYTTTHGETGNSLEVHQLLSSSASSSPVHNAMVGSMRAPQMQPLQTAIVSMDPLNTTAPV